MQSGRALAAPSRGVCGQSTELATEVGDLGCLLIVHSRLTVSSASQEARRNQITETRIGLRGHRTITAAELCPGLHNGTTTLEAVGAPIGTLDRIPDLMSECFLE